MALGTVTPLKGGSYSVSNKKHRVVDVQLTSGANYTTTGEAFTAALAGLRSKIEQVIPHGLARTTSGTTAVAVAYDYTNGKLQAYRYDGASAGKAFLEEVAANVDLSTFTVRLTVVGY